MSKAMSILPFLCNRGPVPIHNLMVFCYCVLGHLGKILIQNPYKYILYPWKTVVIYLKILYHVQSSRLEELSEGYKGYYNANATFCYIFGFTMKLLVNSTAKGEQTPINEYRGHTAILQGHMSVIYQLQQEQ